jgi:rod shape-determining protein MreD
VRFAPNKRLIIARAVIFWAELSLLPFFSVYQVKPDLPLAVLAFYAFRINWKQVVTFAFAVGLIQDLLTNSFFGLHTASYVGGALALQFFALRFDRDKFAIQMTSLFCFSSLTLLIFSAFSYIVGEPSWFDEWFLMKLLGISAYTTLIGAVLFPALDHWLKLVFPNRQYELF